MPLWTWAEMKTLWEVMYKDRPLDCAPMPRRSDPAGGEEQKARKPWELGGSALASLPKKTLRAIKKEPLALVSAATNVYLKSTCSVMSNHQYKNSIQSARLVACWQMQVLVHGPHHSMQACLDLTVFTM
jgi:hypothetical protein